MRDRMSALGATRSVARPLTLPELVGFRHAKKFVEGMEAREVIAAAAIEKTFLPNVDVEKAEERATRKPLGKKFQPALQIDMFVGQA